MPISIERATAAISDELSHTFSVPLGSRSYSKQYAQLYDYRLAYLKKRILPRAHSRWVDNFETFSQSQSAPSSSDNDTHDDADPSDAERVRMQEPPKLVDRILDVRQGEICYVVGNIYCAMPLKPDVLEDLTREQWLAPQPVRSKFVDYAKDELFIEDQSGRVKLVGEAIAGGTELRKMLITGVVAAVLGTETRAGDFDVVDAVFASLPPEAPVSNGASKPKRGDEEQTHEDADKWVVLMSGLSIGGDEGLESELSLQLLSEYITGELGDQSDRQSSSRIVAAIIAGNSLAAPSRSEEAPEKPKRYGQDQPTFSSAPTLALDQLLSDLCSALPVHLLPGPLDPASTAVPQQPIHFALLPRSGRFDSLHRHTNPAYLQLGTRTLLGTSGQNIDDVYKYVEEADNARLDMAARTLEWGHIAPTAPDTLWCYPFKSTDPFVLKHRPDVLFVGNQPSYASAVYHFQSQGQDRGCRVVLIPGFAKTKQVVLLNLSSLETQLVSIDTTI